MSIVTVQLNSTLTQRSLLVRHSKKIITLSCYIRKYFCQNFKL